MDLSAFTKLFTELYGKESAADNSKRYELLAAEYEKFFSNTENNPGLPRFFSSPGRTEIGGNHTDHNLGKVLAASIQLDCIAAALPNNTEKIVIHDISFNEDYTIDTKDTSPVAGEKGSPALIKGICEYLKRSGRKVSGFNACISSNIPTGAGLSSSAAFEMLLGTIISCLFNNAEIPVCRLAEAGQFAENHYWNKASGLLDQNACGTGGMISIDFKNPKEPEVEPVPFDFEKQNYSLFIIDTLSSHENLSEEYSAIPGEMKKAAAYFGKNALREVSEELLIQNAASVRKHAGDRAFLRALHFFEENRRVDEEKKALSAGNFQEFLSVVEKSGSSSWRLLQNVCIPGSTESQPMAFCLALTEYFINTKTDKTQKAVCRIHGGGFAGVIQAFIPDRYADEYESFMKDSLKADYNPVYRIKIRRYGAIELKKDN